jgi:hypothetical protein
MTKKRLIWTPRLETTTALVLLLAYNVLLRRDDPGLVSVRPHPTLFITLLIVVRYGFRAGVEAAALCALEHMLALVLLANVPSFLVLLGAPYATPLVVLAPTAVFVGILVQRHLDRHRHTDAVSADLSRKLVEHESELTRVRDINAHLAEKVIGAEQTLPLLSRHAKELQSFDLRRACVAAVELCSDALGARGAAIWLGDDAALVLAASTGEAPSLTIDPMVKVCFDSRGLLRLADVPARSRARLPLLVGQLRAGGVVVGYLAVDGIEFSASALAVRLFPSLLEWISGSVGTAWVEPLGGALVRRSTGSMR